MHRKYHTEFMLNVFTSHKAFVSLKNVYDYNDGHQYNIYAITSTPRVFIESIVCTSDNKLSVVFRYNDNGAKQHFTVLYNHLFLDILPQEATFEIGSTRELLRLFIEEELFKQKCKRNGFDCSGFKSNEGRYCINIPASRLFYEHCPLEGVEFDVLYVGQAYGRTGQRSAQERLKAHPKLQAILSDFHTERLEEEIMVFLFEIQPLNVFSIDGIHSKHLSNRQNENTNFDQIMEHEHKMKQIINIFEAALINYLKPAYNENLIDNFPNKSHKGYKDYFSLDYNEIMIEIDLDFDIDVSVILHSTKATIDNVHRFITYKLHNDLDRAGMCDIFKELDEIT